MFYIIFAIVGSALTLILHELSHTLMAMKYGCKIVEFKPWPHFYEGSFYFGRMAYVCDKEPNKKAVAVIPLVKAVVMSLVWLVVGIFYHPILMLACWELIDIGNWLQGYIRKSEKNDGGIYRSL